MSADNGMAPDQGEHEEDPRLMILGYVASAVKHLTGCSEQDAIKAAQRALAETEGLNAVIQDGGDATHPQWGVNFVRADGKGTVAIPKLCATQSDEERIQSMLVLGVVTSPIARATAYALGFQVSFFQAHPAPKSRILLP